MSIKGAVYVIAEGRSSVIVERTEVFGTDFEAKTRFEVILASKQGASDFNLALYVVQVEPFETQGDLRTLNRDVTDAVDDLFAGCTLLAMRVVYEHERMSGVRVIDDKEVFAFELPTP